MPYMAFICFKTTQKRFVLMFQTMKRIFKFDFKKIKGNAEMLKHSF